MGLNISHNTWDGAYYAFHRWRCKVAELMGLPPLELMEGFYQKGDGLGDMFVFMEYKDEDSIIGGWKINQLRNQLPIRWDCLKTNPIHELLHHSDRDGEIEWYKLQEIADELEHILLAMEELGEASGHIRNWHDKTNQFIEDCRTAYRAKENLVFG